MDLDGYNGGFDDHCKSADMELKRKFVHKESHNLDSMDHIMQRKDQEFLEHGLLAPDHFIMDLMNFPKGAVVSSHATDTLPAELHFHNALFPVTADEHHHHHHHHHQQQHHHHHSNEPRITPTSGVYMPLNSDFLMPVTKSFNAAVDPAEAESGVKVVQQLLLTETNVTLDDASIDDDCDISRFDSRKILPHKKRISRKLKINHDDNLQMNVPLEEHKLPHVDQLVQQQLVGGAGVQQFRCELCGHITCSQLDFFAHLKQHYEPSTPDNILAAMKTSLDALEPAKSENKKTDGLDQVFQDVHFPFENFPQNDDVDTVRVVIDTQHNVERVNLKMINSNSLDAAMNVAAATSGMQTHSEAQPQQTQQNTQNLVPEEFSDTEDMLEGIRDKVLIEDTCDTMDLMTPTSNGVRPHWFTNTCFNSIDLKSKPFCDVLFSGQFAPILNADPTVPQDNDMNVVKLIPPKELVEPPPHTAQHATDLRLQFTHGDATLSHHQEPQTPHPSLSNNVDLIQPQHIKLEDNPDIPPFHTEDTLSANSIDDNEDHHHHNENFNSPSPESCTEQLCHIVKEQRPNSDECDAEFEGEYDEEDDDEEGDGTGKRYICNKCQRVFNSSNALKYHHRTHSGLRPHQCDICGKSFFAVGALKAHTRTHTGDKPFECEHCNRKFRQWGDLKYHTVSIHSNEKNHQCEFCGKAFSRKYSLVVHLRIHTSERNYKCEFCTKTFRASTYLQNHRKIHTGEKPYECDVCSKKFRVSGDLRRHQRIHERTQKLKQQKVFDEETPSIVKSSALAASPPPSSTT